MFFEKESLSFRLLEVLELKQQDVDRFNSGRNFHALSFRFRTDAVLKTETNEYRLQDNCICYFPARLDYRRVAGVDHLIVVHFEMIDYNARSIEYFMPQHPERFAALFQRALALWNRREDGYRHQCSAILYEIFAQCYAQNHTQADRRSKIAASVEYIHQNYRSPDLSIGEVAKKSFMSEVYFRKLFKQEHGISPQKYIIGLRIRHAAGLISTGYYSLKEVALLSGYIDYKYFSVEFKKLVGVSPSEYLYNYSD